MRIPDEIFEEVAMTLGVGAPDGDELFRRVTHRFPAQAEVTITPAGVVDGKPRMVLLCNISQQGVCIVDNAIMGVGQQFVLSLPRLGGNIFSILCTVKQSRLTANGQYRAGAEFTSELNNQQGLRYVGALSGAGVGAADEEAGSEPEGAMLRGGWPAQVVMVGEVPATALAVTLVEYARSTLGIVVQRSMVVGDRFVVRFTPPGGKPTRCMCVATQVRILDQGKYRVGARIEGIAVQKPRNGLLAWMLKSFC